MGFPTNYILTWNFKLNTYFIPHQNLNWIKIFDVKNQTVNIYLYFLYISHILTCVFCIYLYFLDTYLHNVQEEKDL